MTHSVSPGLPPLEEAEGTGQARRVAFYVPGRPRATGSMRAVGPGVMIEQNPHVKEWRARVAGFASDAMSGAVPIQSPVRVTALFLYDRPKSHYRTGRNAGELRETAPAFPGSRNFGDLDKLLRAVFDAMVGVALHDDSLVVAVTSRKDFADHGEQAGVWIEVEPA